MGKQKLSGKVAVISGSSRGIGKAIAFKLAKHGAYIVLNGRNRSRLEETEKELRRICDTVIGICCDVSTIQGSQQLIDETIHTFGKIDILINNVGVSMRGILADLKPEVFDTILKINVLGAAYPTIHAIKHLRITRGSIVFISSLAGIRGLPFISAYCSSKMALRALAESIRIEEASHHLHVGIIYVGYTEVDPGKDVIMADGSIKVLESRQGKGVFSKESVATAVLRNILSRKFVTILTPIGKLMKIIQIIFPRLVEVLIANNTNKFAERNN